MHQPCPVLRRHQCRGRFARPRFLVAGEAPHGGPLTGVQGCAKLLAKGVILSRVIQSGFHQSGHHSVALIDLLLQMIALCPLFAEPFGHLVVARLAFREWESFESNIFVTMLHPKDYFFLLSSVTHFSRKWLCFLASDSL